VLADTVEAIGDRGATIVDIGSGPADVPLELVLRLPAARIIGIEPSGAMRDISRARGVVAIDGRAEALPLEADSVDLAVFDAVVAPLGRPRRRRPRDRPRPPTRRGGAHL
jgi:ubiquinone/menaquinone biosynthesis C-methylase UbiE